MNVKILILLTLAISSLFSVDFVLFTQPKTGTHLLTPILSDLTGKTPYCPRAYMKQQALNRKSHKNCIFLEEGSCCPHTVVEEILQASSEQNAFLHFHTPYTKKLENCLIKRNTIVFFVKRDPRDQIVSLLNHYKKFKFLIKKVEAINSDSDRLLYMICNQMKKNFNLFKGWLSSPICCVLEFNYLMGSHGGAVTDTYALKELRKVAEALDITISDDELMSIYFKHFGKPNAFFRGKTGAWRDYFSDQHIAAVKREIGDLLIQLGYEKDMNW